MSSSLITVTFPLLPSLEEFTLFLKDVAAGGLRIMDITIRNWKRFWLNI